MTTHNSLVPHIQAYYRALFNDIAWLYGSKKKEWKRDQSRLLSFVWRHGIRVTGYELPSLCKLFDKSLDLGYYHLHESPLMARCAKHWGPKFLGVLMRNIFDAEGVLRDPPCIDSIIAVRQLLLGLKKLEIPCKKEVTNEAVDEFINIERTMRNPTFQWGGDGPRANRLNFLDASQLANGDKGPDGLAIDGMLALLGTLHRVCDVVAVQLGDFHNEEPEALPKHGPGAVSNGTRDRKLLFNWPARLDTAFPYSTYAQPNEGFRTGEVNAISGLEFSSLLISVPKTIKAPRLIAAEPIENQWTQQVVLQQLAKRIAKTAIAASIDFHSQERNRRRALTGSMRGKNATVDLSSASDRLSLWVIERVFRRNESLLDRLYASRTTSVSLKNFTGENIYLNKFATMGSACIFPVQTVVYTLMAIAATLHSWGRRPDIRAIRQASKTVTVFGDDIVLSDARNTLPLFQLLADHLGLKVNVEKTFSGGNFRESCGCDAFRGVDVSPAYAKQIPVGRANFEDLVGTIETRNNFLNKGLWTVAKVYDESLERFSTKVDYVHASNFGYGLRYYSRVPVMTKCKVRWNKRLQYLEHKILQPKEDLVRSRPKAYTILDSMLGIERRARDSIALKGAMSMSPAIVRVGWHQLGRESYTGF